MGKEGEEAEEVGVLMAVEAVGSERLCAMPVSCRSPYSADVNQCTTAAAVAAIQVYHLRGSVHVRGDGETQVRSCWNAEG